MQSDKARTLSASDDRRRAARTPAVFAVKEYLAGAVELCQAEDINPSGMTIRRTRDAVPGLRTPVELEFDLPGCGREIAAEAVVVNDTFDGSFRRTGVKFVGLPSELREAIACFCGHGDA